MELQFGELAATKMFLISVQQKQQYQDVWNHLRMLMTDPTMARSGSLAAIAARGHAPIRRPGSSPRCWVLSKRTGRPGATGGREQTRGRDAGEHRSGRE